MTPTIERPRVSGQFVRVPLAERFWAKVERSDYVDRKRACQGACGRRLHGRLQRWDGAKAKRRKRSRIARESRRRNRP
jgi:hypothetical protein